MKALVTGATGLLGAHIVAALHRTPLVDEVVGLDRHSWWGDEPADVRIGDLADAGWLEEAIRRVHPDVLIHCAAMVNVDACEQRPDDAFLSNAVLTARVARAAPRDCLVVYVTTDGVFQGNKAFASETMETAPRTVYGRSKLQGEREVAAAAPRHLIVRTNFFGWSSGRKQTFAEWLYDAMAAGRSITLFDDFFFTPIYVVDFVAALLRLIDQGAEGLLHVCGRDRVSKYEFGMLLAHHASFDVSHVRRGSLDDASLAAPRPKDMSLSSARAEVLLGGGLPGCEAGIQRFLQDRGRPLSARAAAATAVGSRGA